MKDFVDATAFNSEQGNRARKLFAAVVLAALDDAIADDRKYGNGPEQIARWARSRDGRRKSTRLNSSHITISYAVFCLKKKKKHNKQKTKKT